MDTYRRCSLIILALLWACVGYGQNIRVTTLTTVSGGTNNGPWRVTGGVSTTTGGTLNSGGDTNRGTAPTRQDAPLLIRGGFALTPTLIATMGSVLQDTNSYQWVTTNQSFSVLFGGTPVEGSRGQVDIKNTAATNIVVTWPASWSVAQGALITSFIASSNNITEVFWYYEGGSNRVRVANKEIVANFFDIQPGQVRAFHDANTETNITVAGSGDVTLAGNQMITGIKGIGTIGVSTNAMIHAAQVTNNITYLTTDLSAVSEVTNFVADYAFGARTINMAAAVWIVHTTNHPAANNWKGWSAILRNNSGGALRVGVAAAFKRSGTNNVSVPNAGRAKILIEPDGTGGTDATNHLAQIIVFDSP